MSAALALPPLGETVRAWLREDIPSFDIGGAVVGDKEDVATLFCKASCVMAGAPFVNAVFEELGCRVEWLHPEGATLEIAGEVKRIAVARVSGKARFLLMGERTALNVIARASGIATRSRALVAIKQAKGWHGVVAGTRKTTPGFRLVEKYAMLVGGADSHRHDLSSMVMLKDNHVWSKGSITSAVHEARALCGFSTKIDVECGSRADAQEAIAAGADVVMLDNMDPDTLTADASILKRAHPHVLIEGSGGLTDENIAAYMSPYVDVLSTSWIHQGVPHADFSLKITRK